MKKMVTVVLGATLLLVNSASAYSIKHSYSAGNATEYHGLCADGGQMVITDRANGTWAYEGPAGDGTVKSGDMDEVAKKACGE